LLRRLLFSLLGLAIALLAAVPAHGQIKVTGTITDPNGYAYSNATISVQALSGGPPVTTGGLDSLGRIGGGAGIVISSAPATFLFTVNFTPGYPPPLGPGPVVCSTNIALSGSTQDISSAMSAACPDILNIMGGSGTNILPLNNVFTGTNNFNNSTCDKGPRPWIDVTCYGALGDAVTDDAIAINAAITASCTSYVLAGTFPVHPDVFFPPGIYRFSRSTTNAAPFTIPCGQIRLVGSGNSGGAQFATGSNTLLDPLTCPSGNTYPEFLVQQESDVTLENLAVGGCNESVWVRSSTNILFNNDDLFGIAPSGQTDNTALKVTNSFWVWIKGGTNLGVEGSYSLPAMIFTNETALTSEPTENYLIFIQDLNMAGGGISAIGRVTQSGGPESFVIRNVDSEGNAQDFFNVSNQGAAIQVGYMLFDNDQIDDNTGPGAILGLSPAGGNYVKASGIQIIHSAATYAIKTYDGTHTELGLFDVTSGGYENLNPVVDQNGNPLGNGTTEEEWGGRDHVSNISSNSNINPPPYAYTSLFNNGIAAPQDRWCLSGSQVCTMAMDPNWGLLFGDGVTSGFSSGYTSSSPNSLTTQFASVLPPTSLAGTATTGGTLAAATYYAAMWTTTYAGGQNCAGGGLQSTFDYSAAIVVGGSNNAINFTWADPPAALSGTIQGYCIDIETAASGLTTIIGGAQAQRFIYISGAGTTSFSYTGQTQLTGFTLYAQSPMGSRYVVTPSDFSPTASGGAALGSVEPWKSLNLAGITVASLPSASGNAGQVREVNDSTTISAEGQTCVGGNATPPNVALAFSNGSVWKCF
jgi:Pectate lyase superfamily protein